MLQAILNDELQPSVNGPENFCGKGFHFTPVPFSDLPIQQREKEYRGAKEECKEA
jgi:hypothetical protein